MAYTLEQIYEALGKVENGAGMVNDLKDAITKTRNEAATSRINKNKVLDALGLRDDENSLSGLAATLSALKQFSARKFGQRVKRPSRASERPCGKIRSEREKSRA